MRSIIISIGHNYDFIIINSTEELEQYIDFDENCSTIDFSSHTVLLARGNTSSSPCELESIAFLKNNVSEYIWNVTIVVGYCGMPDIWVVSILVPKIANEEKVLLNVIYKP